jgi:hypothetical protein
MFHVTTLDHHTGQTFTYEVDAPTEAKAKARIIVAIQAGSKRGDCVYEVAPVDVLAAGPSARAYGLGGELY